MTLPSSGISTRRMTIVRPELFAILFVLLGVYLRCYRLNDFPPALYWDEAFDGFDAQRLAQNLTLPVFFEGNNGREPLMIDLQVVGILLWGVSSWVLRLMPAVVGIVSVPVTYRVAVELFKEDRRAKWLGALAAGMLAVSFWDISLSRFSVRAISLPLLSLLTIWLFWRAWKHLRLVDFALSGVLLGLTLYTHTPARILPFALVSYAAFFGVVRLIRPAAFPALDSRRALRGLVILLFATLVVFAPLGLFFVGNPGAFAQRASTTSILSADPGQNLGNLSENAVDVVRMFVDRGDLNPRQNIPGRPALELFTAIGFWIGLLIGLRSLFARPVYLLLFLWIGANLLMTLLTTEAPHLHRSLGALPPIVILAADGLTQIRERFFARIGLVSLLIGVIGLGGVQTFNDYFNVWGPGRNTFFAFDGPTNFMVKAILSLSQTNDVIMPLRVYATPQMQFYLKKRFPQGTPFMPRLPRSSAWLVTGPIQRMNIVLGKDGIFVPQPLDDAHIAQLKGLIKNGDEIDGEYGQLGVTELFLENATEFNATLTPGHLLDANFGGKVRMFGYDIQPTVVAPGDRVRITYYWQALQTLNLDYTITTDLLDPSGNSYGQRISEPVLGEAPTSLWSRGAIFPDSFDMQVPLDAHQGKYQFEVGLLNSDASDILVPLIGKEDRLYLDPITVTASPVDAQKITHLVGAKLGVPPSITLLGYDAQPESPIRADEQLTITLFWRSEISVAKDYSVFIHLLDPNGRMLAQQDGPPQSGNAPTSWWQPGDLFSDPHVLEIPAGLSPGAYTLAWGVYSADNGIRLPMTSSAGIRQSNDQWQIAVQVVEY